MKLEEAIQTEKFTSKKHQAALNVLYTAWWLKTLISQELKDFGLTQEQYNVLRILNGKHPEDMCVKDIGCRMIERSSNVPRIIDRLVSKKLVVRSTSDIDKRETVINLTQAGIDMLTAATTQIETLFEKHVTIDESSSEQLNSLLESVRGK